MTTSAMPGMTANRWVGWLGALCLLLLTLGWAFSKGQYPVSLTEVVNALYARLMGQPSPLSPAADVVFWNIRLPRVIAGALVGATLAATGAVYQAIFRNPLVSPDILGVSSGAGLGASLGLFFGLPVVMIQMMAFAGGMGAVAIVCLVAAVVRRHDPVLVLVLSGMAVGTLLGAGISLLKVLADPYTQLPSITFWLLGGLNAIHADQLWSAIPAVVIGVVPMVLLRWRINVLSSGDEEAKALGVNVAYLRWSLVASATLATAAVVSISGIIGWVGLVVPHAARLLVGPVFERLLPVAMLLGAAYVVAADTLTRTVIAMELPLGILTAIVGAPCLLWLLARGGRERE
jgi:iron complex transport system permease protein